MLRGPGLQASRLGAVQLVQSQNTKYQPAERGHGIQHAPLHDRPGLQRQIHRSRTPQPASPPPPYHPCLRQHPPDSSCPHRSIETEPKRRPGRTAAYRTRQHPRHSSCSAQEPPKRPAKAAGFLHPHPSLGSFEPLDIYPRPISASRASRRRRRSCVLGAGRVRRPRCSHCCPCRSSRCRV